jgi:deoxyribodipyrimidine photo-lyase
LYILDDEGAGPWRVGSAGRWWLHRSLEALGEAARTRGAQLTLRCGKAQVVLAALVRETGATDIYWNRCYEPFAIARDTQLKQTLASIGVAVESSNGALLFEPWTVKTKAGEPFKVFTPYWRACLQLAWRAPHPAPLRLNGFGPDLASDTLSSWKLSPAKPNWAKGFEPHWTPGEAGALKALYQFTDARLKGYADGRDQLGLQATSRLSPHLHFGELSPAQVRTSIEYAAARRPPLQRCADKFLTELGWREFSANLLFHWPTLPTHNWRKPFDAFPWRDDASAFCAWTQGRTGYPIVDAAMRELWTTGYMHNRARMIAASFLIKHLLIDWRRGEAWFWDTLLDADLANNAASWQWVAGSGADAAPYFRIFNPVTQGERFDACGDYVRRWVPELANLPNSVLHNPWTADAATLKAANVRLGVTYPTPIVDHHVARARALSAYAALA